MPRWTRLRGRSRGDTWQKFFSVQLFGFGHCSRATNTRTINLRIMCYKPASFLVRHKHLKALPIQHNPIWYTYNHTDIWFIYIYNTYDTNKNRNNTLRIAIIIKSLRVTPLLPILQGFSHGHLPKNGLKTCPWWKVKIQSEFWMVLEWYFHDQRSFALLMLVKLLWYHVFGCKNFAEN